ncbi:DMT family transporter [Natrinema hispanicum]|uniref:Permease of the drug/metabolite transporter (DMT) superfamily n=1 Tax=Natrinema hispanicum TaxID=392421 RepID=A0A1G6YJ89_9EURY|nr:DMT family transporter [Natrinema hispanicum]SDD90063.1 Permease of the drug/metabolite transporter (DMT) superfamily [Natrinema hispanicum]
MVIVGSSVVVAKIIVADFPIFLANELRFLIAASILVPLYLLTNDGLPQYSKRDTAILASQAFTGVFLFNVLLFYGIQFTNAAEAGIITSTTPAFVAVIAVVFLNDQLTRNTVLGVSFTVLGILAIEVLGSGSGVGRGPNPLFGNFLIFGAVLGEALFTILGKAVSDRISPLEITTAASVFGVLLFLPFALYELTWFDVGTVPAVAWIPIVYYGVVVTVVAFMLWFRGVAMVPASTAGVFTGMLPVSAVLLSYLLLGEPFLWSHVVGIICVVAGIVHASRIVRNTGDSE